MMPRLFRAALLSGAVMLPAAGSALMPVAAIAQEALRPAVGKPLQRAQAALRSRNFPVAMKAVDEADAVSGKSAYESYVIAEMRAAVAQSSGNEPQSISADDALIASSRTSAAEKLKLLTAEAGLAYTAKDYPAAEKALERYFKAGGSDPQMHTLLIQSYYLQKDYKNAARAQANQIAAEEKAHQKPTENQLNLLASVQQQAGDMDGFNATMIKLVQYYPKPNYWAQLIHGLRTNPNIPDRLQYDIARIRLAVGLLTSTGDFMDTAETAVQLGYPMQGQKVMAQGYASGALGKDAGAAREAKLKALIDKAVVDRKAALATDEASAEKSPIGDDLLRVGYNYVDAGQVDHGIDLMKQGIAKGRLVNKDEATLHLGLAYMDGGRKADAIRVLKTVPEDTVPGDLAQLWILQLGR